MAVLVTAAAEPLDTLVFGDRPAADQPWRIRAVDLTSGAIRDLTSPPRETLGDSDPSVSPNGSNLIGMCAPRRIPATSCSNVSPI